MGAFSFDLKISNLKGDSIQFRFARYLQRLEQLRKTYLYLNF